MREYKLTIELVPKTAWYTNVRSNVSKSEWDRIRSKSYTLANNVCEICGETGKSQGYKHNVECHEIWEYDDTNKKQTLIGLVSLCVFCHKCKHPGLAQINGELNIVINQLMKVNNITKNDAEKLLDEAFNLWRERSKHKWTLDISYIENY
jgi:5-methylcytosine-specific restriction endonuclease McrA